MTIKRDSRFRDLGSVLLCKAGLDNYVHSRRRVKVASGREARNYVQFKKYELAVNYSKLLKIFNIHAEPHRINNVNNHYN